jgi:hypothetical protein
MLPNNGLPARCMVRIDLDEAIPLTYPIHEIQLFVPTEFATLLQVGFPLIVTLDQFGI